MKICFISACRVCGFSVLHVQMLSNECSLFSLLWYLSLVTDKLKKHKCINNGLYEHWRAWFRDWNIACQSIIKAYAYCLKSTNLLPGKFWASVICVCVKQTGSGYDNLFLAVHFRIRALCLCLNTMFRPGVRQWAGF